MAGSQLRVGFAEVDVTPPTGLPMCGGLDPRPNYGTADPLLAKTIVAESEGRKIAIVGVDIIGLPRSIVDPAIADAAQRTGIAPGAILVCCSHTHSGPYTSDGLYSFDITDAAYLGSLPGRIAESIERASKALQPATMAIGRSLVHHGLHYRRVLCKDGKAYNTWMPGALNDLERCPQVIGAGGPIDPELWVARFDGTDGKPVGILWNFSLHVNSRWGQRWSADYPAVVAEEMQKAFGPQVICVFTAGACANINPTLGGERFREGAEYFASEAIAAAKRARPVDGPIVVDAVRRDLDVPRRTRESQPPEAIGRLDWGGSPRADVFEPMVDWLESTPPRWRVPVNAARIGPLAVASNPGELFVEHGLSIKQRSPFPHTVVAELTNDLILYQPTRAAMAQQGYETLIGANRVAIDGIERIVDTAVELLQELWERNS